MSSPATPSRAFLSPPNPSRPRKTSVNAQPSATEHSANAASLSSVGPATRPKHMPWVDDEVTVNGRFVRDNFASWFSAHGIKASDGQPLVVFRGDKAPPDEFGGNDRREHGLFFAEEYERAACYGTVRAYVLKAENILDFRDPYGHWFRGGVGKEIIEDIFAEHYEGDHNNETGEPYDVSDVINGIEGGHLWMMDGTGGWHMHAWRQLQHLVEAHGFDGLVVPDGGEGRGLGIDWIVFGPDQVKCVSDHAGLFLSDSNSVTDHCAAAEMERDRALRAERAMQVDRAAQAMASIRSTIGASAGATFGGLRA